MVLHPDASRLGFSGYRRFHLGRALSCLRSHEPALVPDLCNQVAGELCHKPECFTRPKRHLIDLIGFNRTRTRVSIRVFLFLRIQTGATDKYD